MAESDPNMQDYNIMNEFGYLARSALPPPFTAPDLDDATLVLLGTSMIDEFLKLVLVSGFTKEAVSKRRVAHIFDGDEALATFSAKISLATLLGLTTADATHDLTLLRKIRNRFAHSHERLYLRDFPACLSLRLTSKLDVVDEIEQRRKFKHSCGAIIGMLATTALIRIAAFRFLDKNADGVRQEYDAIIKEAETHGDLRPSR
jgi:hypothetical protein